MSQLELGPPVTRHGREGDLGTRSIFSLPRVVRSINVQYLPYPQRDTSPQSIVLINQSDSEVKLKQITNGQNQRGLFCDH